MKSSPKRFHCSRAGGIAEVVGVIAGGIVPYSCPQRHESRRVSGRRLSLDEFIKRFSISFLLPERDYG